MGQPGTEGHTVIAIGQFQPHRPDFLPGLGIARRDLARGIASEDMTVGDNWPGIEAAVIIGTLANRLAPAARLGVLQRVGRITARLRPDRIDVGRRQRDGRDVRIGADLQRLLETQDRDAPIGRCRVAILIAAREKIKGVHRIGHRRTGRQRGQNEGQNGCTQTLYINHRPNPRR